MHCKIIKALLFFSTTSMFFIAGCGPEDLNDPEYLAQIAEADDSISHKEGGCPVGGCPTGGCAIPPEPGTARAVRLPDQISSEPTKIIPTRERQDATDIVDYHTTKHIYQPSETHHTTHMHRHLLRRHHTKVVLHPTHKRINQVVRTASASDEVMPTVTEVAPPVDYGCVNPPPPQPVVVVRPVAVVRPVYPFYGWSRFAF